MPLSPGTKLGAFEITDLLGKGGMGEVYRARDTKLGREVAIKVLSAEVAADAEYLKRFEKEARTLASLDHPNIGAIYDFGCERPVGGGEGAAARGYARPPEEIDVHFLVMQLVEGETLADRILRGPIPLEDAIRLFSQVADGLEVAHARGIVHRDLKPANIKISADDRVKVLDFGIAKSTEGHPAPGAPSSTPTGKVDSHAPTRPMSTPTRALTGEGALVGTPQYMSPEQVRGKDVDHRSDVWAFGVCFFETITGTPPFKGETLVDVVSEIVRFEPDWSLLASFPPVVETLLRRLLHKDRRRRLASVCDFSLIMEDFAQFQIGSHNQSAESPIRRFTLLLPEGVELAPPGYAEYNLAISADGSTIACIVQKNDSSIVAVRRLEEREWILLDSTIGACMPSVSPDGSAVAYVERHGRALKRIDIARGRPVTLAKVAGATGVDWSTDGYIYSGGLPGTVRVPERGGAIESILGPDADRREKSHGNHHAIPGAQTILFVNDGIATEECTVSAFSMKSNRREAVYEGGIRPRYIPTGHMVCSKLGKLVAIPFDPHTLKRTGSEIDVSEPDLIVPSRAPMHFAISDEGTFVYVAEGAAAQVESHRTLVFVDHQGNETPVDIEPGYYQMPRISPDGTRIAMAVVESGERSIWIYDRNLRTSTRLTFGARDDNTPLWSQDGTKIVFTSNRDEENRGLYWISADGSRSPVRIGTENRHPRAFGWTPDGASILISAGAETSSMRVGYIGFDSGETALFDRLPSQQYACALSPDGRWIAYTSVESGRHEVYVQSFPELSGKWQISRSGGTDPVWSPSGDALYYMRKQTLVKVETQTGPAFSAGRQTDLFHGPYVNDMVLHRRMYDVCPDGSGYLMIREGEGSGGGAHLNVILNWFEEIRRLSPESR